MTKINSKFEIRNSKLNKSFTLIELLIFMVIFSVMTIVMTQIFSSILDAQKESESVSNVDQDANFIISRLSYDLGRTTSITQPALGSTNASLQLVISAGNYTYALSNGNLILTSPFGTDQLNNFNTTISNLSFQRLGNSGANSKNTVRFGFTIISKTVKSSGIESKSYQTTVGIR